MARRRSLWSPTATAVLCQISELGTDADQQTGNSWPHEPGPLRPCICMEIGWLH